MSSFHIGLKNQKKLINHKQSSSLTTCYRERSCFELYSKARAFVLRNFIDVGRESNEILEIGLEDFIKIIGDDMLNTKDEVPVWECCLRWIKYNPESRKEHIYRLLCNVRLGLLDTEVIMDNHWHNMHKIFITTMYL